MMNVRIKLAALVLLAGCSKPEGASDGASAKSLSDITSQANGQTAALRECSGKYRAFAGVKPEESSFLNFSDAERQAFNTAATAVPGWALYLYGMVLDGSFEVDASLAECGASANGPCTVFKTEAGEFGTYKMIFEAGADKIASHLPFATGLAMVSMARYQVKAGKPTFTDLPADAKADLEEVKALYLEEAKFDLTKTGVAEEVASIKKLSLDFFGAHALDSSLCNGELVKKDTAAYPKTMAKMATITKDFAPLETAFAAANKANTELVIPEGLSPLVQRLAENLKAGMALAKGTGGGQQLGLWGKGGIGGGGKVAVGEGPLGRTVFENPVRASGGGILNSKADRFD